MDDMRIVTIDEFRKEPQADVVIRKQFAAEEVVPEDDLILEFVISTESVDRDGDTIKADGWKIDRYLQNPVVLFAHDYRSLPVANALGVWAEGGKLKSRAKFTPKDLYPFGHMVYQFYREGFMRATSVGFNPIKWRDSNDRKGGIDFLEQELLEFSCVPVPANPEALVVAERKGIDVRPLKEWAEQILDTWSEQEVNLPRKEIEEVYKVVSNKTSVVVPELKGAISYNGAHPDGTPKAPEDAEWDAGREVAAADVDDLKVMCAWVDSENPDIKGSYKLPHHTASNHAVVWRGVAAAMGALMGARGGVQIPDADRRGVYNHLARHYGEFDREPPEFAEVGDIMYTESEKMFAKANRDKIREAIELLQSVIGTEAEEVEPEPTDEPPEEPIIDEESLKELVKSILEDKLRSITGRE